MVSYIFSFIAVIIFTILTAWDAQRMKQIYENYSGQVSVDGLAVAGALALYLDFVILFLQFLRIVSTFLPIISTISSSINSLSIL